MRLEELRADPARDTKLMAEWQSAAAPWACVRPRTARPAGGKNTDPNLPDSADAEELRVSLFAAGIAHADAGFAKRLQKVWESMQR